MLTKKSGLASRTADLRIDFVARESAKAVRAAGNAEGVERFLNRFLDCLHDEDNATYGISDSDRTKTARSQARRAQRRAN